MLLAMRLVVWNCNMAAHRKVEALLTLRPDVAVLAECAGPGVPASAPIYAAASSHVWAGLVPVKGLAALGFGDWRVTRAGPSNEAGIALPVHLDGPVAFNLLALWTQAPGYVEAAHAALDAHASFLGSGAAMVAGDLNSNAIWDRLHRPRNHSALVARMEALGLVSAYHRHHGEAQGAETRATYFHHRHPDEPFHIDHAFVSEAAKLQAVEVGDPAEWLRWSDHMPIVIETVEARS